MLKAGTTQTPALEEAKMVQLVVASPCFRNLASMALLAATMEDLVAPEVITKTVVLTDTIEVLDRTGDQETDLVPRVDLTDLAGGVMREVKVHRVLSAWSMV